MPFTFKAIPDSRKDYTYGNKFISLTLYLKLVDNLEKACEMAKKLTTNLKKSTRPTAMKTLIEFYAYFLPNAWNMHVGKSSGAKHSVLLSNVPGYKIPVYYGGQRAKRFFYMGGGSGNICTAIVLITIEKRFNITVSSDDTQIKDTKAFAELFNKEFEKLGLLYDPAVEGEE